MLTPYSEELNEKAGFISYRDGDETVLKFPVKIHHLIESEVEVACLFERVAGDKQFPVEERKIPERLLGFTGHPIPGTREPWVEKSMLEEVGFE